ncbi:MAG TPA: ATP-binding protein [Patescibacteria group bacterium]|nr:ATP-binding protein [Patescibacteria group bacterium]
MIQRKIIPDLQQEMQTEKVIVLTGMRRVGKTTIARYFYDTVHSARKLFLDLENPLNQSYFETKDYDKAYHYLQQLSHGMGERLVVFLDEVQSVKNIASAVKYVSDHYQVKFFLTGSASFYLKNLFTESLAGRKKIFELYPLDFSEFLSYKAPQFKKPVLKDIVERPIFDFLSKYVEEYVQYGGFPSVVLKVSKEEKYAEIADIVSSYFQKEVLVLADFRKLSLFKDLMFLLSRRTGSKLDISKLASTVGLSRLTVLEYLDFLQGTYFFSRVRCYSQNLDVVLRKQAKGYVSDVGFLTYLPHISSAAIFENAAYNLLRQKGDVYFYQTKHGAEIDFVVIFKNRQKVAFEVKETVHAADVKRLKKMAEKLGCEDYFVMSKNFSPLEKTVYLFQL